MSSSTNQDPFIKFTSQKYDKLKSSCLSKKKLFVDDLFPANDNSLFRTKRINGVKWKRPHEICSNPKFVIGGINAKDVNQGQLGNCWFVAALSVLTSEKKFLNKVVPNVNEQEINEKAYAGIFKFCFWQFGKWIEIVVDDLLPTVDDRLIFTRSSTGNEFWSSLLEKAYAKLHGCYEHLDGGNLNESLQDFTGGICENIEGKLHQDPDHCYEMMKKAHERGALLACAIKAKTQSEMEQKLSCGLVKGHAYGITKIQSIKIKGNSFFNFLSSDKLNMIRLKNPWGEHEWLGPWSDHSDYWTKVPKSEKDKIGLSFDEDGEFWMDFSDFLRYFDEVCICRNINTSRLTIRKTWTEGCALGEWKNPNRAGGCVNNRETFCNNPQYIFDVESTEDSEEVIINLDQLSLRYLGRENLTIGFYVMRVEDNRKYRLHQAKPKTVSATYINTRSVFLREFLPVGRYIIIPSTFDRNIEGKFLLRIYTDSSNNFRELTKECPTPVLKDINPFAKFAKCVTSVLVKSGSDLDNRLSNGLSTYVVIKCEDKKVNGRVQKNTLNPEWNTSAIFYRYNPKTPIKIEVWMWAKNKLNDELYGEVILDAEANNKHLLIESEIKRDNSSIKLGRMTIEVKSMTDVKAL